MADIVLLHGTTQSSEGWKLLSAHLVGLGHQTHTADLTSGDASADDYAAVVAAQMPSRLTAPIVVAHSGAGVLLPAVTRRLGGSHQVWLAAIIPGIDRPLRSEIADAPSEVFNAEWLGQNPVADPVLATYFLFHDCGLKVLRWALSTLRAFIPERVYDETIDLATEIPSTSIVATQDRTLRPAWQIRATRERLGVDALTIDAGHCPHVSRSAEVAAIIALIAR